MASPRLTKAERIVQEQMLALLEWAAVRPKSWHPIGTLTETVKAAELLASRGVIEIRGAENQYRLKPKSQKQGPWKTQVRTPKKPI
jgi:hypothetical protein